jgi:hypothetical protein
MASPLIFNHFPRASSRSWKTGTMRPSCVGPTLISTLPPNATVDTTSYMIEVMFMYLRARPISGCVDHRRQYAAENLNSYSVISEFRLYPHVVVSRVNAFSHLCFSSPLFACWSNKRVTTSESHCRVQPAFQLPQ